MQTGQPETATPQALGPTPTSRVDPDECEQSIAERFEQQVARYPDRLAVKTRHHALTYAALNRCANRVAHALLRHSDEPGQRVGLLLDHDAPLIAAVLGTLKAGQVYVPLNPSHPLGRSRALVERAQAALILTDTQHRSVAADLVGQGRTVINVDDLTEPGHDANVGVRVVPDDLAYILFTSGSTGEPKGVVQIHRNVLHFALEHAASCKIGPNDRLTLLASLGYAAAGLNLYGALLNGAAVFPFNPREASVGELVAWLERQEISVYHSVPTVFRNVVSTLSGAQRLHRLRVICLGGEPALKRDTDLYQQHLQHFAEGCVLVNGLASTETMVIRRFWVDARTRITSRVLPAGYPVDGAEVFLVDEAGKRLGPNQVGEIVVRSRYLVPGYWQQPELTARVFSADDRGARLYRTGDLGRLLPDGCLEYIGRKDLQVKVRGHRVEPAEVELALLDLDGVEEAAVVPRRRPSGDSELVAYLVVKDRRPPTPGELRRSLRRSLPEPLIPAALVAVDALPRTANGKVDRAALSELPATRSSGVVPPRNPVEARLLELWENVLGICPVGVTDDFFELGGHSLLASLLMTEIERVFGKRLAPASLFPDATLAHQARLLSGDSPAGYDASTSPLVPIRSSGSAPPFFCVHPLGGDVLCFARLAHHLGPDQPFYAFQDRSEPDQEPLDDIAAMAARYIQALRSVQPEGPYRIGGFSFGGTVAFEIAQQLHAAGQRVALLAILDHAPFTSTYRVARFEPRALARTLVQVFERPQVFFALEPQQRARYLQQGVLFYLQRVARGLAHAGRSRLAPTSVAAHAEESRAQDAFHQFAAARPNLRRFMEGNFEALAHLPLEDQLRLRRVIEAEYHALASYVPRPYPGRLTLFRARAQPLVCSHDPSMGWSELAAGGLEVRTVPGLHAYILKEPFVRSVAHELASCLAASHD